MTWLRAHYDRVAVLAGALFLFLSGLFIMQNAWQLGGNLARPANPAAAETRGAAAESRRDGTGDGETAAAGAMDLQQPLRPLRARKTFHRRERPARRRCRPPRSIRPCRTSGWNNSPSPSPTPMS